MVAAGKGAMIFTGATSSVRGGGWLAFSSAKFALRGLTQALARELWPQGIHVAHVVVDGLIGARGSSETDSSEPAPDPDRMAVTSSARRFARAGVAARTFWDFLLTLRYFAWGLPHSEPASHPRNVRI